MTLTISGNDTADRGLVACVEFPAQPPLAFGSPRAVLVAHALADVRGVLDAAERASIDGAWVVGFVSYEAAPAFDDAFVVRDRAQAPLVWFAVFDAPAFDEEEPSNEIGRPALWLPEMSRASHAERVTAIRNGIARGDFYQVNLTFCLAGRLAGAEDGLALFRRLRAAQPDAYAAFIDTGEVQVVSASPELFFERRGAQLVTRPMKGTAARGRWAAEDQANASRLASSEKDRAENLMIVDLLRNDLGRIARVGSVRASRLCELEAHPTVWQLTSTVEAEAREGVTLADIFGALFPCGSITGAPKVAAMRAIATLETSPRGVYCGAIGVIRPGGDAMFSVAIRTATIDRATGHATYGVGGGITWDSAPASEYEEALAKARVLTHERPSFGLIETLRIEDGIAMRRDAHLARLAASARYFGFADPLPAARAALDRLAREHPRGVWRARVGAAHDGSVSERIESLAAAATEPRPVRLAGTPVDPDDIYLYHKTTRRGWIDRERAGAADAFDVLFVNTRGELTEFGTGNLVVELDGERVTPPLECGLLPGIFRGELLARGDVRERVIRIEDLDRAGEIWLVNSLREWVAVRLAPQPVIA